MFLHLGNDTVVPLKNIITINDLKAVYSKVNDDFIKRMDKKNKVNDISGGNAKSFIITDELVYLSAISSLTLKKRADYMPENEQEDE